MSHRRVVFPSLWLVLAALVTALNLMSTAASAAAPPPPPPPHTEWCVLVYMDGDNPMEGYAIRDIYQMQMAIRQLAVDTPDTTIRVLVQLNRYKPDAGEPTPGWDSKADGDYDGCHRFELFWADPAKTKIDEIPSDDLKNATHPAINVSDTPLDMTDPDKLVEFISWGLGTVPDATHYALILWNRYSDWDDPPTGAAGNTDGYGATPKDVGSVMPISSLAYALRKAQFDTKRKLDLIYMDASQVAKMEYLYQMTGVCDYLVASEVDVPKVGAPYGEFLDLLWTTPTIDPVSFGQAITKTYVQSINYGRQNDIWGNQSPINTDAEMGLFDMSKLARVNVALNSFADELITEFYADPNGELPPFLLTWWELSLLAGTSDTMDLYAFADHCRFRALNPTLRNRAAAVCDALWGSDVMGGFINFVWETYERYPWGIVRGVSIYYPCNLAPDFGYLFTDMSSELDWDSFISIAPLGYAIGWAPDAYDLDGDAENATDAWYFYDSREYHGKHWFFADDDTDAFQFYAQDQGVYFFGFDYTGPLFDGKMYLQHPDGTFELLETIQNSFWWCRESGVYDIIVVQNDQTGFLNPYGGRTFYDFRMGGPVFTDLTTTSWGLHEISACQHAGIVQGAGGKYLPWMNVSRDQMAAFVARALCRGDENVPEGPATPSFSDVPADHWAYKYVEYCKAQGIVQGYGDLYAPEVVVDRGQMAAFLTRALVGGDAAVPAGAPYSLFPDVRTDYWAYKYIDYALRHKLTLGYGDGTYRASDPVTRDQMAVFIARGFLAPKNAEGGLP